MSTAGRIIGRCIGIRATEPAFFTSSGKRARFPHDETWVKHTDCMHLGSLLSDLLSSRLHTVFSLCNEAVKNSSCLAALLIRLHRTFYLSINSKQKKHG